MLYASIALVVGGLVLIAYSFAARNRHGHPGTHYEEIMPVPPPEAVAVPVRPDTVTPAPKSEKRTVVEKARIASPSPEKEAVDRDEMDTGPVGTADTQSSREPAPAGAEKAADNRSVKTNSMPVPDRGETGEEKDIAVLYADASGVVDYESGANTIDPTFKKYSKLRRIGKGKVGIIKDGLNFQLRKKLFRFDFYRIQRMVTGKNYLALFLKGSEEVRLMIFEGDGTSLRRIINEFNAFRKRSM